MEYYVTKDGVENGFDWSDIEPRSTVYLIGNFQELVINNVIHKSVEDFVRVTAESGSIIEIESLILRNCNNLIFDGSNADGDNRIIIHSKKPRLRDQKLRFELVKIRDCIATQIQFCRIYSDGIAGRISNEKKWRKYAQDGITVKRGHDCNLNSNLIENVYHAISLMSQNSSASSNGIYGYCGDGIRLLDNETMATGNRIAYSYNDCIPLVDCSGTDKKGNHNDAMQIWNHNSKNPNKGKVSNLTVTDNIIYCPETNYTNIDTESQGICCFNGKIRNSEFLRNNILTNHNHGITLFNPKNCTISDNVVVPADENEVSWIAINRSKKGSSNSITNNKLYGSSLYIDNKRQDDPSYIVVDGKQEPNTNKYLDGGEMNKLREEIRQIFEPDGET